MTAEKTESIVELKKWLLDERADTTLKIEYWTTQRLNAPNNKIRQDCQRELEFFCAQRLIIDNVLEKINELEKNQKKAIEKLFNDTWVYPPKYAGQKVEVTKSDVLKIVLGG